MRGQVWLTLLCLACAPPEDQAEAREPAGSSPAFAPLPGLDAAVAAGIEQARERVRSDPRSAAHWGELAMRAHAADLPALAHEAYGEARVLEPEEPRWPYLEGLLYDGVGDPERALACFEHAFELSAEVHPPLYWRLGNGWLAAGELERAEGFFRQAIAAAPLDPAGWFGLARVQLQEARPEEALEAAREGLRLAPQATYGHGLLGDAYRRLGRWDEAKRELAIAGDAAPVYRDSWEDALAKWNKDSFTFRWQRAAALFERGREAEAIPELEALQRDYPDNPTVLKLLAEACSRTRRRSDAEAAFGELLSRWPDRQARLAWVEHNLRNQELDVAQRVLEELLGDHPEDGQALYLRGRVREMRGERALALESYRQSLFHDQRNPGTRVAIGRLELESRQWAAARATLEAALDDGVQSAELFLGLSEACLMLEDSRAARAALQRAKAIPGADRRALLRLERALEGRAEEQPGEQPGEPREQ